MTLECPGDPVVRTLPRAGVQSMVRELRSHKLYGVANKYIKDNFGCCENSLGKDPRWKPRD